MLARLLLVAPVDLYARWMALPPTRGMPAGSSVGWLASPLGSGETMSHFVKHFVLVTWWLGAVAGAILLRRRGSRSTDAVCGLVAGGVAGLAGSATLACFLPALDWLPQLFWHQFPVGAGAFTWFRTLLWIMLAAMSWALLGALFGLVLSLMGPTGTHLLNSLERALLWLYRLCFMPRLVGPRKSVVRSP